MTERAFPARTFEIGGGRILPSPNQFYLTGEDTLRVVSVNAVAGVRIKIACRTAPPQGGTVAQENTHVPASDRSKRTEDFAIGEGSLLNVTVFASAGAALMGQTYVLIQLVRGAGAAAVVLGTVLGGCITQSQALGFPGSPIIASTEGLPATRTIVGTQPAAGAELHELVPTGARWQVRSLTSVLTASAAAGNRTPALMLRSAGNMMALSIQIGPVPAATGYNTSWAVGVHAIASAALFTLQAPIPDALPLLAGQAIDTFTAGLAAGDQYFAPIYVVSEWLEVP